LGTLIKTRCPRCATVATMVPIVFGYPSPEMAQAADRGEVALGGCMVSSEDPTHVCAACSQDVILDRDRSDTCSTCGRELSGHVEDDPTDSGGPICGECNRARTFDLDEELAWAEED
jgi:DNA-directed RNA polymerase subunit RPC12/RpoP